VFLRGVELVGRVNDGPFTEKKESRKLSGFQDGSLAVLAGDHETDLESCPLSLVFTGVLIVEGLLLDCAGLLHEPRLPRVEIKASQFG
jgi:hypothetical protein